MTVYNLAKYNKVLCSDIMRIDQAINTNFYCNWKKNLIKSLPLYDIGPDRLESIIHDITEKKIDNPHSRLQLCFSL